jgi:hypothetical protein
MLDQGAPAQPRHRFGGPKSGRFAAGENDPNDSGRFRHFVSRFPARNNRLVTEKVNTRLDFSTYISLINLTD